MSYTGVGATIDPRCLRHARNSTAFSLLELLLVMAVLIMIMMLLTPVVKTIKRDRKNKEAFLHASELVRASKEYRTHYHRWPAQDQGNVDITYGPSNLALVISALTNNARNLHFLDIDPDLLDAHGCLLDPWSQPYYLAFDANGDGIVCLTAVWEELTFEFYVTNESAAALSLGHDPESYESLVKSWAP